MEEDHHFRREGDVFFRNSRCYRFVIDRETGAQLDKELILENHSRIMYDPALIPKGQICEENA